MFCAYDAFFELGKDVTDELGRDGHAAADDTGGDFGIPAHMRINN